MACEQMTVESRNVAVEQVPLAEIVPYEANPRTHPESQIETLVKLIERIGFRVPILLDAENVIIAGHGRVMAAERLGMDEVPAIRVDDLSPEEIKAWRLADNKVAELSEWSFDLLSIELQDLQMEDFGDLEMIGFTEAELVTLTATEPAPSLEDLEDQWGDHKGESFWPVIRLKVPPETKEQFDAILGGAPGEAEHDRFAALVAAAEVGADWQHA